MSTTEPILSEQEHRQLALKRKRRRQLSRGMYILPSLFTSVNIAAGFFAITQIFDSLTAKTTADVPQHLNWAALAICLAIPFDSLDGRIARLTKTTTEFGKELDSLADLVTFGVAPSLLAFVWGFRMLPESGDPVYRQHLLQAGVFICFLFLLSGAARLARFNISHDPVPRNPGRPDRKYFVGMPIPAGAGILAATVHFFGGIPLPNLWSAMIWLGMVALTGFLMVSTWRFWSGKEITLSHRHPFQLIILIAIFLFLAIFYSGWFFFYAGLIYMFSGLWARAAYSWSRRRRLRLHFGPKPEAGPEVRPEAEK
jgi:CDP-diacylglycerol--serine O-phosphatidyltransferase